VASRGHQQVAMVGHHALNQCVGNIAFKAAASAHCSTCCAPLRRPPDPEKRR
jgi:hypothetical protein